MADPLLETIENLSRFHRDHEKFYAQRPREQAVSLQAVGRALSALADRWERVDADPRDALNPYQGADDLNADAALQLAGVLFMEGEGEPAEIARIKSELRTTAAGCTDVGDWLSTAMARTWDAATALIEYPEMADLLGDRHRVIANDWQAASMSTLAGRVLDRAADLLDRVDFSPDALRSDLAADRRSPSTIHSAVEMIDHAADLLSDSAGLVHDNERRWRQFHRRVADLLGR